MTERQSGRTTRQMQAAPQGATFVWCNNRYWYPRDLARRLGRGDLHVVPLDWLAYPRNLRRGGAVVLDHAAWDSLKPSHWEAIHHLSYLQGNR